MNDELESVEPNYYQDQNFDPQGLRYRLEADDVIVGVVDTLRGGVFINSDGSKGYNDRYRLMNEEGIARVELFIKSSVNKISHLTKYKNEGRILQQMKAIMRAFIKELVLNMKNWAPESKFVDGQLVNDGFSKVRNKHLVMNLVEQTTFASLLRGGDGFEAELTGKSWSVLENVNPRQEERQRSGMFSGLFGRRGGGEYG